jgi:hypothetical protein
MPKGPMSPSMNRLIAVVEQIGTNELFEFVFLNHLQQRKHQQQPTEQNIIILHLLHHHHPHPHPSHPHLKMAMRNMKKQSTERDGRIAMKIFCQTEL